ncbi:hypothetical protein BJ742DRAFT_811439 [Cladochytrium replicatum]|nr:hypothetical protein BJ742DRAFT_811439 [Cladochytrium replicatum]
MLRSITSAAQSDSRDACMDFVTRFPEETVLQIFSYLSHCQLSDICYLSAQWKRLASDKYLWRKLYLSRFAIPEHRAKRRRKFRERNSSKDDCGETMPSTYATPPSQRYSIMSDLQDWKSMYVIQHRWDLGQCNVLNMDIAENGTSQNHEFGAISPGSLSLFRRVLDPQRASSIPNPLVTFCNNVLFSSSPHDDETGAIHVRRISDQTKLGHLIPAKLKSQATRVVLTAMCTSIDVSTSITRLLVGYSNGGYVVWEFPAHAFDSVGNESIDGAHELASMWFPQQHRAAPIVAIATFDDVVVTCSNDFQLTIYALVPPLSMENGSESWRCQAVQSLRANVCWEPVDLVLSAEERNGQRIYIALVAYSVKTYEGVWEVGVQDICFTRRAVISTHHYLPQRVKMESNQSNQLWPHDPVVPQGRPHFATYGIPLSLRFQPPYLISGHSDNTVQIYTFDRVVTKVGSPRTSRKSLFSPISPRSPLLNQHKSPGTAVWELNHVSALHGHSAAVTAIAVNSSGKLITGGLDGIKVWNLPVIFSGKDTKNSKAPRQRAQLPFPSISKRYPLSPETPRSALAPPANAVQSTSTPHSKPTMAPSRTVNLMDDTWERDFLSTQTASSSTRKRKRSASAGSDGGEGKSELLFSTADVSWVGFDELKIVTVNGGASVQVNTEGLVSVDGERMEEVPSVVPGTIKVFSFF